MFKKLTDLSYKRTPLEAFGFYIAYIILSVFVIALFAAIAVILLPVSERGRSYIIGRSIGGAFAIMACPILSSVILVKKKITANFICIIIALSSAVLASFGGVLLGLIPTAFLTTRENKS